MKTVPVFFHPSRWLFVDDDRTFLNTLVKVLNEQNQVVAFQSARACADFLKTYHPFLAHQNFLRSNTSSEHFGVLKHTPIDFDVTSLLHLREEAARYDEITVAVIDYNMPELDGLTLAQLMQEFAIEKILLTGEAKDAETISAFNKGLIQRFLQKGEPGIEKFLIAYLQELTISYFQHLSKPIISCLETEKKLPLTDPVFVKFFTEFYQQHHIKEYYLIDKQGSFLCIDAQGKELCLVMQTEAGLKTWLADYHDNSGTTMPELIAVKDRKKIPFFGVGKEGWQIATEAWSKHFYTPQVFEGREKYYWAMLEL